MAAELFRREICPILTDLFSGVGKSRVECEEILPDYKEEAFRIVRADLMPQFEEKKVYLQGQNVIMEVSGNASFCVLYRAENAEGGLSSTVISGENFTCTFRVPLPENTVFDPENAVLYTELFAENVNCKLLGPRRLSLRGDVCAAVNLKVNKEVGVLSPETPDDVEKETVEAMSAVAIASTREDFTFTERVTLPPEYQPVSEICDLDAYLYAEEAAVEDGVLSFNGKVSFRCGYTAEDGTLVSFYQPIEFRKSVALMNAEPGDLPEVMLLPGFLRATPDLDENGVARNVQIEIGYTAQINVFRNEKMLFCRDVFSTSDELILKTGVIKPETLIALRDFGNEIRFESALREEGITRAEGIRASIEFKDSYWEENAIVAEGKLSYRFIGIREDGEALGVEGNENVKIRTDFAVPAKWKDLPMRVEVTGGVESMELLPTEGKLAARAAVRAHLRLFAQTEESVVLAAEREKPFPEREKALLFYYPDKDETLWQIARKYRVHSDKIRRENHLEGEALPHLLCITLD